MSIKDGGPFHPCEVSWSDGAITGGVQTGNRSGIHTGASLRDEFAKAALIAIIPVSEVSTIDADAKLAYLYADAMIRAREAGQ